MSVLRMYAFSKGYSEDIKKMLATRLNLTFVIFKMTKIHWFLLKHMITKQTYTILDTGIQ